jgi:hypothetical protein
MIKVELEKVYDTLLSSPGMGEMIKIDFKMSRKTILLMSHVMQKGIIKNVDEDLLLKVIGKDSLEELKNVLDNCLEKGSLNQLHHNILNLTS